MAKSNKEKYVIALIDEYIKKDKNKPLFINLPSTEKELGDKFKSYLNKKKIKDFIVTYDDDPNCLNQFNMYSNEDADLLIVFGENSNFLSQILLDRLNYVENKRFIGKMPTIKSDEVYYEDELKRFKDDGNLFLTKENNKNLETIREFIRINDRTNNSKTVPDVDSDDFFENALSMIKNNEKKFSNNTNNMVSVDKNNTNNYSVMFEDAEPVKIKSVEKGEDNNEYNRQYVAIDKNNYVRPNDDKVAVFDINGNVSYVKKEDKPREEVKKDFYTKEEYNELKKEGKAGNLMATFSKTGEVIFVENKKPIEKKSIDNKSLNNMLVPKEEPKKDYYTREEYNELKKNGKAGNLMATFDNSGSIIFVENKKPFESKNIDGKVASNNNVSNDIFAPKNIDGKIEEPKKDYYTKKEYNELKKNGTPGNLMATFDNSGKTIFVENKNPFESKDIEGKPLNNDTITKNLNLFEETDIEGKPLKKDYYTKEEYNELKKEGKAGNLMATFSKTGEVIFVENRNPFESKDIEGKPLNNDTITKNLNLFEETDIEGKPLKKDYYTKEEYNELKKEGKAGNLIATFDKSGSIIFVEDKKKTSILANKDINGNLIDNNPYDVKPSSLDHNLNIDGTIRQDFHDFNRNNSMHNDILGGKLNNLDNSMPIMNHVNEELNRTFATRARGLATNNIKRETTTKREITVTRNTRVNTETTVDNH